ncbi:hypothetical protein GSI_09436 [Ganoderma sinense ZZ0214-1]|uniref:F-box domain-containing protein n=1 Tax=Ganoderma sinense ZZ0214-1 TaxID=1077348 RepID=A0A2G8S6L7_9APHY|nr:hypothetical protein GSI_09436 [Ganoderma sinense ZZ0214-1]
MALPKAAPFSALPPDILDHIAFALALADPSGPPCPVLPLLCTSSHVHYHLSVPNNAHLYARIFRAKFDYRAPARRMCQEATYASALTNQLVHYSRALHNIRRGDIHSPSILHDFYRLFTLALENDGRNVHHLNWARYADFLHRYVLSRLWQDREESYGWPLESPENAFALWLYFFSLDHDKLSSQSEDEREHIMSLLRPYALYNFRYPPFLVPDNHVHLPLAGDPSDYQNHSAVTPHGYYPLYRDPTSVKHTVEHFGMHIAIAEPSIGLVAKLLYIAHYERWPVDIPDFIPCDRTEANELNLDGPTIADYDEFASRWAIQFPARGTWDWRDALNVEEGQRADSRTWRTDTKGESAAYDNDWERWRGCYDPWDVTRVKGPVYTFGSLSGMWGGQYLVPDVADYHVAMNSAEFLPVLEHPQMRASVTPLFFKLHEHHCVSPARPLPHWEVHDGDPFDEGVLNAYFPRGFPDAYVGLPGAGADVPRDRVLRLRKRGAVQEHVYETFVEGKENSHDEETCEICIEEREAERAARMEEVASDEDGSPTSVQWEDGHICTGNVPSVAAEDAGHEPVSEPENEDARVERIRREVQHVLGPQMDVEQLIEQVARQEDGSDDGASCCDADLASDGSTDISRTCSGILDIILTGETLHRHALAWGDFRIYGRVRAWDGLVVLVRTPIWHGPDLPRHDTFIFRGYLVGGPRGNLVGSWRHITGNVHSIPVEGPFVVSRIDERDAVDSEADAGAREGREGEEVGGAPEQQPAQDNGDGDGQV